MTISDVDYDFFHALAPNTPGAVIPFAVDLDNYEIEDEYIPSDQPELFHLGSMNWMPNVEGLEWFLEDVFPAILEKFPSLTFTMAGRSIPESLQRFASDHVIIAGEVESANEFMLSKDIMIVPLLSGSGIRIKIIEGMALGKTIITTSIGAEGLNVENGKHIFIADTAEEFIAVIEKCIKTPDICTIIGENARHYVALNHNILRKHKFVGAFHFATAQLYRALMFNSILFFTPRSPVYIFHSMDDNTVPFVNATKAEEYFKGKDVTYDFDHYGNHQAGAVKFILKVYKKL